MVRKGCGQSVNWWCGIRPRVNHADVWLTREADFACRVLFNRGCHVSKSDEYQAHAAARAVAREQG